MVDGSVRQVEKAALSGGSEDLIVPNSEDEDDSQSLNSVLPDPPPALNLGRFAFNANHLPR